MNKTQVRSKLMQYLKSHFINFEIDLEEGTPRYSIAFQGYDNSPDKAIESCIWFYDKEMEVRTYYTQTASNWCKENMQNLPILMRLFNYINACVWFTPFDGVGGHLYEPRQLHTPRIYLTEDGYYDITLTTIIDYRCFEIAPLETADYITACCPALLDSLSPAIFFLLLGKYNLEDSIQYIQTNILNKK